MLVGQVEYRRELWWRFGAVAFAGAGQVGPTFGDFQGSNTRPGGGVGLRFAVAPKNHINLRVDYSVGQGSHAWYVGVAEAF
jgi:outer membrane translocation and assembly module TamA